MSSAALRNKFPISQEEILVHEMTTCRLLRYSTQTETRSLFPKRIYSTMRWRFVDYYGTRHMKTQDFCFPRRISHPWDDNPSTTTVLDSSWDKISTSQEESFTHEVTTHRLLRYSTQSETRSPFPRRNYQSTRQQTNWLLQYSRTQLKVANVKLRKKATRWSVINLKEKYYTSKC